MVTYTGLSTGPSLRGRGVDTCAIEVSVERDNIVQIILVFIIFPVLIVYMFIVYSLPSLTGRGWGWVF